jgi:hypothetical protein
VDQQAELGRYLLAVALGPLVVVATEDDALVGVEVVASP